MTLPPQKDYLDEFIAEEDPWHILWLDGCRWDIFNALAPEYVSGTAKKVYNGGHGYTRHWSQEHFDQQYNASFLTPQPIYEMLAGEWDEREHFTYVEPHQSFEWDSDLGTCPPPEIYNVIVDKMPRMEEEQPAEFAQTIPNNSVIRFLQPHPPFRLLTELTRGKNRIRKTKHAITKGEVRQEQVLDAYRDNLEWVLETVELLVDHLEGRIAITSDHGEMLGEVVDDRTYWYHGPDYPEHDALCQVPWMVVE